MKVREWRDGALALSDLRLLLNQWVVVYLCVCLAHTKASATISMLPFVSHSSLTLEWVPCMVYVPKWRPSQNAEWQLKELPGEGLQVTVILKLSILAVTVVIFKAMWTITSTSGMRNGRCSTVKGIATGTARAPLCPDPCTTPTL
jgi:hypothetical protein